MLSPPAKPTCEEAGNSNMRAFIRVYVQIPYVDTEFEDFGTRRYHATRYKPEELIAEKLSRCEPPVTPKPPVTPTLLGWHQDKQAPEWPVPEGFLLHYAWEVVNGVRLGDVNTAYEFWLLEGLKRDLIRAAFRKLYCRVLDLTSSLNVNIKASGPRMLRLTAFFGFALCLLWDSDGQKL